MLGNWKRIALLLLVLVSPQAARADSAVLGVVEALFNGMRSKNEQQIREQFVSTARIGAIGVERFVATVLDTDAYLDEITFDETVLVDGDLAIAWTPYNLYIDGLFHHCGVDLFIMRRVSGHWRITQLEDTRRTEGCDPMRR